MLLEYVHKFSQQQKQYQHSIIHHRHHPPWLGISSGINPGVLRMPSSLDGRTLCRELRVVLHHHSMMFSKVSESKVPSSLAGDKLREYSGVLCTLFVLTGKQLHQCYQALPARPFFMAKIRRIGPDHQAPFVFFWESSDDARRKQAAT